MSNDSTNTGARAVLGPIYEEEKGLRGRLIRIAIAKTGYVLLALLLVVFALTGQRVSGPLLIWFAVYVLYHLLLELLSRYRKAFYETPGFRIVRVLAMFWLATTLVNLTGGYRSDFWFAYLWPLMASAMYFPSAVTLLLCALMTILYFVAAQIAPGALARQDLKFMLANVSVLFGLALVMQFLVTTIQRLRATRKALTYSELMQQMQLEVDNAVDSWTVVDTILRWAVELAEARTGSILFLDEDGKLHFRAWIGGAVPPGKKDHVFVPNTPDEGIAGWVVRTCERYICTDTRHDEHFVEITSGDPIRSLAAVPIILYGRALGVICVDHSEPNQFSDAHGDQLASLANHVAAAIERSELLESLQRISQDTAGGSQELNQRIVDALHRLTRRPVNLWWIDEATQQARIVAARGTPREYAQKAVLDLAHSATGRAVRERRPIRVEDIQADPDFQYKEEAARAGWQSVLIVPLLAGAEPAVGTLNIYNDAQHAGFATWELDLLRLFASQAAVALQRAQLLERSSRHGEMLQSLFNVAQRMSQLTWQSPKGDLERIASSVCQAVNADCAVIYPFDRTRADYFDAASVAEYGLRRPLLLSDRQRAGGMAAIVREKGMVEMADLSQATEEYKRVLMAREGIQAFAGVSLRDGEQELGLLYVNWRSPHQIREEERQRILEHAQRAMETIRTNRQTKGVHLRNLLSQIVQDARVLLEADLITLYEYEQDEHRFVTPPLFAGEFRQVEQMRYAVEERDAPYQLVKNRQPWYRDDVSADKLVSELGPADGSSAGPAIPPFVEREGVRSSAGVLLQVEDEIVGTLFVNYRTKRRFTAELKQEIGLFASQAAVAIRSTRALAGLDRRLKELAVVGELGRTLAGLDLDGMLDKVYEQVSNVVDMSDGLFYVALYDRHRDSIRFGLVVERDNGKVIDELRWGKRAGEEVAEWKERQHRDPPGLTEYVIRKRLPVLITGGFERKATRLGAQVLPVVGRRNRSTKSWLGVPMLAGDRVVGMISVQNLERERAFDKSNRDLLMTVANQTAVAVVNAELRSNLEEEVEQRTQELQEEQRKTLAASRLTAVNAIAAGFVHKVNNLAGTIPVRVDLIREHLATTGRSAPQVSQWLDKINNDVEVIVNTARAIKGAESADHLELVEIEPLVSSALQRITPPHGIDLTNSYAERLPRILVLRNPFVDSVENLIRNGIEAVQATGQGGQVSIAVKTKKEGRREWVTIAVADSGCGIGEEDLPRVGELFFTKKEDGMGFAVWRAKTLVESLGGRIDVSSTPGEGTTFTIFLPSARELQ